VGGRKEEGRKKEEKRKKKLLPAINLPIAHIWPHEHKEGKEKKS